MNTSTSSMISTRAILAALLVAGSQIGKTAIANTPPPSTCTVEGLALYRDPVFVSSLHHTERDNVIRDVACEIESTQSLSVGDITIRLTLGKLYNGKIGDPLLGARLVTIEKIDASGAEQVGRVLLGNDSLTGEMAFEPQARSIDGEILIRLSRRHAWIFQLQDSSLSAQLAFGWRGPLADEFYEPTKAGANLSVDLEKMEGRIAARTASHTSEHPFVSAYDENRVLVAKLAWRKGKLVAESSQLALRKHGEEPFLDQLSELDDRVKAESKVLPPGTEVCSLGAWSEDTDAAGLNVRAAPDAKAKVLGIVPPPRKIPKDEAFGDEPVKSEFRIVGYQKGWFLIDEIKAPGVNYGASYPRALPQPYKGRGWVNSRMVGAAYAHNGLPSSNLYLSPHADAGSIEVRDAEGKFFEPVGSPTMIRACSGSWGLVETKQGQRGWRRGFCSNQVTNCS